MSGCGVSIPFPHPVLPPHKRRCWKEAVDSVVRGPRGVRIEVCTYVGVGRLHPNVLQAVVAEVQDPDIVQRPQRTTEKDEAIAREREVLYSFPVHKKHYCAPPRIPIP